ncbi:serine hydrolase [Arthrobacter sp. MYb227]|uniref:serine hydrolase domain-containing protein n=1 Tax=Arthrobacter sp. MYb227 TaxID=1848601 RepID=UPI0015E330AF|nr:serine hydrolase domain-containing protein [Arthrobacter sp. MYb227]
MRTYKRFVTATLAVLVACLVFALPVSAGAGAAEQNVGIDHFVEQYLETHHLPGASIALVRDGEVLHEAGYGQTATGAPLTESSLMRIESTSKPFTAFAVLQLVKDHHLDLDDPVIEHLPEFNLGGAGADKITVRQLLSHTSGVATPTIIPPANTLAEGVARTHSWSLASEPGSSYRYSNANYWIAARMVEVVTGQPFNDYLAEHIFTPAGMADTLNLTTTTTPVRGLELGHVLSYGLAFPVPEVTAMISGAGGMVSTAHDMALWVAVQQRNGQAAGGQQLLSAELVEESHRIQPHAKGSGLGWMRSSQENEPLIQHSGVGTAYNAQVMLDPAAGYGVVVLLNSFTPTLEHAYEISSGILDLSGGANPQIGVPAAIWIDLGLAGLTLLALVGGVRGLYRARPWAQRRRHWGGWRFGLRLVPQLFAPAGTAFLFLVLTSLQGNSFTPSNVFWLYPAFMVLLLVLSIAGIATTGARLRHRLRTYTAAAQKAAPTP